MSDATVYDDIDQPVAKEGLILSSGSTVGFTFTTGSASGTLSDVDLGLVDATPDNERSVAMMLLSGEIKQTSGLFSDRELSYSTTSVNLLVGHKFTLATNTTYTLNLTEVLKPDSKGYTCSRRRMAT